MIELILKKELITDSLSIIDIVARGNSSMEVFVFRPVLFAVELPVGF